MKIFRSGLTVAGLTLTFLAGFGGKAPVERKNGRVVTVIGAVVRDVSLPLAGLRPSSRGESPSRNISASALGQDKAAVPLTEASVEQTEQGTKSSPEIVAAFEGLGEGFEGPQGTATFRNPSDNSLAVGPDHIVQTVNSRMAVFSKKGARFKTTGEILYGPVDTNNVFRGFGSAATVNNGDAVVRYDQLADRWLIVMPIFRRLPPRENKPATPKAGEPAHLSLPGVEGQPGPAMLLFQPPKPVPVPEAPAPGPIPAPGTRAPRRAPENPDGAYAMCYAVSTGPDPLGSYYRYEFVRPLFPDYPRPTNRSQSRRGRSPPNRDWT